MPGNSGSENDLHPMTTKQFIKKFPDSEINANCLQDMACPQCGARGGFNIQFTGTCTVYDDCTEEAGDHEWDNDSDCICNSCDRASSVKYFIIEGLDDALRERQKTEIPE
jgi:hypothetical protein